MNRQTHGQAGDPTVRRHPQSTPLIVLHHRRQVAHPAGRGVVEAKGADFHVLAQGIGAPPKKIGVVSVVDLVIGDGNLKVGGAAAAYYETSDRCPWAPVAPLPPLPMP